MKKHFLLLMMAFFSLAGWAQDPIDLSQDGWTIVLTKSSGRYTGESLKATAGVTLESATLGKTLTKGFNATWSADPINVGSYTVTVSGDWDTTVGEPKTKSATFNVLKGLNDIKDSNYPKAASSTTYVALAGGDYTLISNAKAPEALFGNVEYKINDGAWSTDLPKASKVGSYTVKYRVEGSANYVGIDETALTAVVISGTGLVADADYVAPTAPSSALTFKWTTAAVAQDLIKDGTGTIDSSKGTIQYSFKKSTEAAEKYSAWSATRPTASDAATYDVKWKIVAAEGYADVAESSPFTVTINPKQPTVTAAKGATTLIYSAEPQLLLATAGSATDGATDKVKYQIMAPGETTYAAAVEYANAKGTVAGTYKVLTVVPKEGNYLAANAGAIEVTIDKADAFTAAPKPALPTWNGQAQELIDASGVTSTGIVKYSTDNSKWTTDVKTIKGTAATDYDVWYKVDDANYKAVTSTKITGVKINKKVLSVRVNNITKTYNGYADITGTNAGDAAADPSMFTFMGLVEGDATDFSSVKYVAIEAANKNAGTYEGVVTVKASDLNTANPNYEYTIIPGNLTINKAALTVAPVQPLTTVYGTPKNISGEYTITGYKNYETSSNVFSTLPELTSNAASENPEPGDYTLSFTEGTLKTPENYAVTYTTTGTKFTVTEDPSRKLVITVLPHEQEYTGVAESWDNMVEGTDYAVSGLVSGDALLKAPVFSRTDATNFNASATPYTLNATLTLAEAVADPSKYPGGIVINPSTFTIKPRVLTATIDQQTLKVGAVNADLNQDAWSVEGLQNGEAKSDLEGTLKINSSYSTSAPLEKADGIVLTIINKNYTFKGGMTATGKLIIISTTSFRLDPTDTSLDDKIQAAGAGKYDVQFGSWKMNEKEWYAVVLPIATTPAELVGALGKYVIVNRLKNSSIKDGEAIVNFGVEMDEIPAGEPFLIKAAADVDWSVISGSKPLSGKVIAKTINDVVTDKATFTGTYESGNVLQWGYDLDGTTADADAKYRWLAHKEYKGDNNWKNPKSNPHTLAPMEAYLVLDPAATKARIYVEDIDENGATAIKSLSVDDVKGLNVQGWYSVNGMKLQGAPTQKGVYIKDGKKVIVK